MVECLSTLRRMADEVAGLPAEAGSQAGPPLDPAGSQPLTVAETRQGSGHWSLGGIRGQLEETRSRACGWEGVCSSRSGLSAVCLPASCSGTGSAIAGDVAYYPRASSRVLPRLTAASAASSGLTASQSAAPPIPVHSMLLEGTQLPG